MNTSCISVRRYGNHPSGVTKGRMTTKDETRKSRGRCYRVYAPCHRFIWCYMENKIFVISPRLPLSLLCKNLALQVKTIFFHPGDKTKQKKKRNTKNSISISFQSKNDESRISGVFCFSEMQVK